MKQFFIILIFLIFHSCTKPQTVVICGDHVCVNKQEAEQYFEKNLSIEVKIIDRTINKEFNLIELNLKDDSLINRKIDILSKEKTRKKIKVLSNEQIIKIKKDVKSYKKNKRIIKANNSINQKGEKKDNNLKVAKKIRKKKTIRRTVDKKAYNVICFNYSFIFFIIFNIFFYFNDFFI